MGACAAALTVAGCGDERQDDAQVTLSVTRDFGRTLIARERLSLEGHGTALRLLRESHRVELDEFGGVSAIDGLRAGEAKAEDGHTSTWAIVVNGIEDDLGARDLRLLEGDVVQFDLRDWYVTLDVRATVGAFPQPFTGGMAGIRFPVSVRCAPGYRAVCDDMRARLRAAGVDPDGVPPRPARRPGAAADARSLGRVVLLVGPWRHWRDHRYARRVDRGAGDSGIFARFAPDGRRLRLLDWNGHRVREHGAGTGLVGAMRPADGGLLWVVTGTDRKGVERAVAATAGATLRDAFAVAVTGEGVEKLPLPPPRQ